MLLIYITTFVALASIWSSLHHVMIFIKSNKVVELILWSNHWILLIVCLFPFSTVAHAEHPNSLTACLAYVSTYLIPWISLIVFSQIIYKQYNGSATLRKRNLERIKIFLVFLLPGALISLAWLYALPIVTILMAINWVRHNNFD